VDPPQTPSQLRYNVDLAIEGQMCWNTVGQSRNDAMWPKATASAGDALLVGRPAWDSISELVMPVNPEVEDLLKAFRDKSLQCLCIGNVKSPGLGSA